MARVSIGAMFVLESCASNNVSPSLRPSSPAGLSIEVATSETGQPKKSSQRAYVFRVAPDSCRKASLAALTLSARSGHSLIRSRTAGIDPRPP